MQNLSVHGIHGVITVAHEVRGGWYAKARALIKKISPVAWRHIHLNRHYTFRSNGQVIDLAAIVVGLEWG